MRERPILRVGTKLLIPFILLFALYVQIHGDFGPGGGFQAGVIFASAFVLYALVFGIANARAALPPGLRRQIMALGVLLYAGVGVVGMLAGGAFLDYSVLAGSPTAGQHIGIFLVELGVGMTVFAAMTTIFFVFASRDPGVKEES
jgi:multicomponent Na+:H+ antiporter subunit B